MEILYLLVPLAAVLAGLIVWGLLWAIRSGQFDDLERPGHEILWDDARELEIKTSERKTPPPAIRVEQGGLPTLKVTSSKHHCANRCSDCVRRAS